MVYETMVDYEYEQKCTTRSVSFSLLFNAFKQIKFQLRGGMPRLWISPGVREGIDWQLARLVGCLKH